MGTSYTNADVARWKRQEVTATEVTKARNRLADKIVTVCVDITISQIIRPGPVAEERECYDVANELRGIKDQMVKLVAEVLRVSAEED